MVAAAVAALLRGCNGSEDQVLGTVVSRRSAAELDQMVTCLADLLPLRIAVRDGDSFAELMRSAKVAVSETLAHRSIPFSVLLREIASSRDLRMPPLCQVVLVVDDIPKVSLDMPEVWVERLYVHSGICKLTSR